MIAVAFLALCIVWGLSLLRLFGAGLSRMERIVAGPVIGFALGGWLLYQSASIFGRLGPPAFTITLIVFLATFLLARRRPAAASEPIPRWFAVTAGVLLTVFAVFNLVAVMAPTSKGFMAFEHVWSDTPFHTSIITSFAYRENLPPHYPLALGQPLNYPFLVDFLSGVLLRYGLSLRMSIIVVNVIVQTALLLGLALIVHRLTSSAHAAVITVALFFLLGNLGWLAVPGDISKAGGIGSWLGNVPWSYTGETSGQAARDRLGIGLYLGNPVFLHLLPRRAAAFGMSVGATLLLLLDDLVRRKQIASAVLVGLVAGVLPRVHAHTAIDLAVVGAVWVGAEAFEKRRNDREGLRALGVAVAVAGVAAVIALPEVLQIRRQTGSFFAFWPGWTGEPREAFTGAGLRDVPEGLAQTLWFWFFNAGVLLVLIPFAWLRATVRQRRWYVPFLVVWLIGFLVRTQPWEWDNNNHFVWWQAASVCLVAPLVAAWLRGRSRVIRAAAVAAFAASTTGGVLSFAYAGEHRLQLWSRGDVAFAEHVRERTPRDAVILTANGHTQPVSGLSGRQVVMGYAGWFSTQGLDGPRYEADVNAMLAGDVPRMRRLGIDYVVIGPWEIGQASDKHFTLGTVFDDRDMFDIVLAESFDGRDWKLLRLRPRGSS